LPTADLPAGRDRSAPATGCLLLMKKTSRPESRAPLAAGAAMFLAQLISGRQSS
jgi:hypothetical protein